MEAGEKAAKASYDCSVEQDAIAIQTMEDNGLIVREIDLQPLKDAVAPLVEKYCAENTGAAELVAAAEAELSK